MKFTKKPLNTLNKLSKKSTKFFKRNLRKIFKGGGDEDIKTQLELFAAESFNKKYNTAEFYKKMRDELIKQGGLSKIKEWLVANKYVNDGSDELINDKIANVFVVKAFKNQFVIKGKNLFEWSNIETEHNEYIENKKFVISFNKLDFDNDWKDNKTGSASMSKHHRFLTIKDSTIRRFNVLTFGMDYNDNDNDNDINPDLLKEDIELLKEMKQEAYNYVKNARVNNEWPDGNIHDVGLYFHCFPFNSVQSLHLHIVDLKNQGPSFDVYKHKNLEINYVIQILEEELHPYMRSTFASRASQWKRGGKKHTRKLHKIKRRKNNTRRRRRH